jgi:hypothetical protein
LATFDTFEHDPSASTGGTTAPLEVPGGRAGENTWNSRLAEALRHEGYSSADFEILFPTLRGLRKPDVVFQCPRGTVVISGKLGSTNEVDAIVSAQEYQATLGKVAQVCETFAITFPRSAGDDFLLRVLGTSQHDSIPWKLESLDKAVEHIVDVVKADWANAQRDQESSISSAIRVLQRGVEDFSGAMVHLPLEDVAGIFGGGDFFESVVGYGPTHSVKQRDRILRFAASYLFLNQVLFYEVLARETKQFPPIAEEDYSNPMVLKPKYFDLVLKRDYRPIFSFDVASKLRGPKVPEGAKKIIVACKALFPGSVNHDLLGKVFHNIIDRDFRKLVAAYFTSSQAGDFLARMTIGSAADTVMDPACGSGTLLVSAYRRKAALLKKPVTREVHRRYVERDLTGIDIMAFSAHLAAVNLALQAPLHDTDLVRIAVEDSTAHKPNDDIRSARDVLKQAFRSRRLDDFGDNGLHEIKPHERARAGAVSIGDTEGKGFHLSPPTVILMNPPFTSCDNLPAAYKEELERRFSEPRDYADCITGKLSFQAYFILLADRFLEEGGKLGCVLPFTTFSAQAFRALIEDFLLRRYTVRAIIVGLGRSAFSDNTQLAELLFIAEKRRPGDGHRFVLVGTKRNPADWHERDIESLAIQLETCRKTGKGSNSSFAIVQAHPQSTLRDAEGGLQRLVAELEPGIGGASAALAPYLDDSARASSFSLWLGETKAEVFAWELRVKGGKYYGFLATSIVRGVAKKQKFKDSLILTHKTANTVSVTNRLTGKLHEIPTTRLRPCVRRLSDIERMDISRETDFVIAEYYPGLRSIIAEMFPPEEAGLIETRLRRDWKAKVDHGLSQVCLARRIDLASPGTHVLAVYSKEPAFLAANSWGFRGVDDRTAKMLTLWFNSTPFLHELLTRWSRTRGSWGQLDQNQLVQMHCPDFPQLNSRQRDTLSELFDEAGQALLPSIQTQLAQHNPVRTKIDSTFLDILGVPGGKPMQNLIAKLQDSASQMLRHLRSTMRED